MSTKPLFVATHPRACSTAFERVFMTRRDTMQCVHEPFGDAWYFGPERLHDRFEDDEQGRIDTGFSNSTYKTIFDRIADEGSEGKRVFIKDMAQYWIPPSGAPVQIAPSLLNYKLGAGTESKNPTDAASTTKPGARLYPYSTKPEDGNPTVVPKDLLAKFHIAFLIRHPKHSIPSYYHRSIPPQNEVTGWDRFRADEAGYSELRRLFDYLRAEKLIGPELAAGSAANGVTNGSANDVAEGGVEICVIDADDLLDNPSGIVEAFCKSTGVPYEPEMLKWDSEYHHKYAKDAFEKWRGWHDDAINSTELRARTHAPKSDEQLKKEWTEKYGAEAAKIISDAVQANVEDYEYLKRFAIQVPPAN